MIIISVASAESLSSGQRQSTPCIPSSETLFRAHGESNCAPWELTIQQALLSMMPTWSHCTLRTTLSARTVLILTLQMRWPSQSHAKEFMFSTALRTECFLVAQPYQELAQQSRVIRAISFSCCSVAMQGVLKPWQRVAESVRAQAGNRGAL